MEMNAELQATCAALGYEEKGKYFKEPDCLETVKDLIRFLKREDETCDIRRQLGESQILQKDLLPIVKEYKDDRILLETVLRLVVNLTQPAILCWQNNLPGEKTERNFFMNIEEDLRSYKEAFADEKLFAVLAGKLGELLQLDWESRQEEDRLLIERILILIRNVLHVPPNPVAEKRTDDDASVHDQVLWAIHVSGMEDLLLYLASSEEERQFALHVVEIISLMFREQTPDQLASAGGPRSLSEREKDEQELAMIREQEKAKKQANLMKYSTRHSRFGGTFTVANMKSISTNNLIYHRSLGNVENISFDHNKRPKKTPKNRKPITEEAITRRSTLAIRLFMKDFCVQFLENCYNPLMGAVKDMLNRAKTQDNDETYYLWAMRFFMEFNRKYQFRVDLVSETMSVSAFHYIHQNLQNYHEMRMTNKKEGIIWSKRMHLALKAYYELLMTLHTMANSKDDVVRQSAEVLQGNVFYMMEYRDIFVVLLKNFDESRQSRALLRDLVESTHLFLKMLDKYCNRHTHLMVQKKKKKHKKKKNKAQNNAAPELTQEQLEEMWDTLSSDLSAIFQGRGEIPEGVSPFDAASEVDVEQQRAETILRIHDSLRQSRPGEAVALFRAAREVWPDREEFGQPDIQPEQEFMSLREIFFANLPGREQTQEEPQYEDEETDEEEQMQDVYMETSEQEFSYKEFVMRFVQPNIVKPYTTLLHEYKKNSAHTNHCIVKMLHRIGFDCANVPMLFQVSLFRAFQKIMYDPICKAKHFKEIKTFAVFVLRKFFDLAANNPKLYMEIFFWKTVKETYEITEGYGSFYTGKKAKVTWTEEEEEELRRLYEEYHEREEEGMDIIDHIMVHMIDQTKTRRQILKQLCYLGIVENAKQVRKFKANRRRGWEEQDEMQLRELYEQHKDDQDPMSAILDGLEIRRSRYAVIDKLLEIGLIMDKKEMRRKRKEKKKKKRGAGSSESEDEGSGDEERGKERKKKKESDSSRWNRRDDRVLPTFSSSEDEAGPSKKRETDASRWNKKDDRVLPTFSSSEDEAEAGGSSARKKKRPSPARQSPSESESEAEMTPGGSGESSSSDSESEAEEREPRMVTIIRAAAKHARKKGLDEMVTWMQGVFRRTADDREEDGDEEPVPIVTLSEEQEDALENKTFKGLLKRLGVRPPANEQEVFWRIPGKLSPSDLRTRADSLDPRQDIGEKKLKSSSNYERLMTLMKQKKEEKEAGGRGGARRKKKAEASQENSRVLSEISMNTQPQDESDSDSQQSTNSTPGVSQNSQYSPRSTPGRSQSPRSQTQRSQSPRSSGATPRSRLKRIRDSDSESETEGRREPDAESQDAPKSASKRVKIMSDSESEAEDGPTQMDAEDTNTERNEPGSFPATMYTQPPADDSDDSDIDDHIPLKRGVKKAAIESDSE